jgi:hypothetical protein
MVSFRGGIPSTANNIQLSDIMISYPTGTCGGVFQHDNDEDLGYAWQINDPSLKVLSNRNLSNHSVGIYMRLSREVGLSFQLFHRKSSKRHENFIIALINLIVNSPLLVNTREDTNVVANTICTYRDNATTADDKQLLLIHMNTCLSNDEVFGEQDHRLKQTLATCGVAEDFVGLFHDQGWYESSKKLLELVVATRMKIQGVENSFTLGSMQNLASVLMLQGKNQEAEQRFREVIPLEEKVLGKEHPTTLISLQNLASVFTRSEAPTRTVVPD